MGDSKRPSLPLHIFRANDSPRRPDGTASPSPDGAESVSGAHPAKRARLPPGPGDQKLGSAPSLRRRGSAEAEESPPVPAGTPADFGGVPAAFAPGGWLLRTAARPPQADNRRDEEGNTALMRAARDADFAGLVGLLAVPGTDVALRNHSGLGAYDLLRRAVHDRACPEFVVISQALFLRTMLGLLIREEHFARLVRGALPPLTARDLAKKVLARISSTYASQPGDRELPCTPMPSLDFIEAAILAMQ